MRLSGLNIVFQKNNESVNIDQVHSCLGLLKNKPQINADERRFVNLNIQRLSEVHSENGLTESPQRAQSLTIPVSAYETAATSRFRTQMTQISTYGESHTFGRRQMAQRLTRIARRNMKVASQIAEYATSSI